MLCFCTVSSTSVPITVTTETAKELGTSSTRTNHTLQIHLFFRVAHLGESWDTPAEFQGEMHLLCGRKESYLQNKIPQKVPQ